MMAIDVAKTYRPAQWWEDETATLLDIANVLGRWETAKQWSERTEFAVVEKVREEDMAQAATIARYDYARRQGQAERCALAQNVRRQGSSIGLLCLRVASLLAPTESA